MRIFARFASLSLAATLLSSAASAQSVDYEALQDTIGEPVTTSVTGKPQRASETPASLEIITRDQIAHSPAHDVPGLLKTYAGVDVNRWTGGQTDVAVRGGVQLYNPQLLVMVDGRQVYLDHYGMTDWNLLGVQLEEIQQIELVRGPATALFGFNAASAVINIITIRPQGRSLIAAAEGGNHGYRRLSAVATLPIGQNVALRVSGGHQRDHERGFADDQVQPTNPKPVKRDEVDATLEASLDARTRLTINGGHSINGQLELLTQVPTYQHFKVTTAGGRLDRDTGWGSLTGRVYANWLNGVYGRADGDFGYAASAYRNRILVAQSTSLVRLGLNNTLRLSAEYRKNQLDSATQFSDRIGYSVWSGSGMIDLHPTQRIALTLAGRFDHVALTAKGEVQQPTANLRSDFDRTFNRPSFNAAALFQVGEQGQLRVNGGLGYQMPSLINFGARVDLGTFPGYPTLLLAGSPFLDPVAVWSGEVGYSQPLGPNAKIQTSLFYTQTRGAISTSANGLINFALVTIGTPVLVQRFSRVGDFRTAGAEVSVEGKIGARWTWRANYTFTDTAQELGSVQDSGLAPRDATARHKVNAEVGYQGERWFTTSVLRYTPATHQIGYDASGNLVLVGVAQAFSWDQKIGLQVGPATLTLTGENLTGAQGAFGSLVPADRRVMFGVKLSL